MSTNDSSLKKASSAVNTTSITTHAIQQMIPNTGDEDYFTAVSTDKQLKVRISKHDLDLLPSKDLQALRTRPVEFLMTTETPLLLVYKAMTLEHKSNREVYFDNTTTSGYCLPEALRQLMCRQINQIPPNHCPVTTNVSDQRQRRKLHEFIEQHLIANTVENNPDIPRLRNVIQLLKDGYTSIDSIHYMGLENIHLYSLNFQTSCWSYNTQDEDFLSLVYTNRLGSAHNFLGCHAITVNQYQTITNLPNDFHQSKNHFYIVPTYDTWSTRQSRLRQALSHIAANIQKYIGSQQQSSVNSTVQSQVSLTDIPQPLPTTMSSKLGTIRGVSNSKTIKLEINTKYLSHFSTSWSVEQIFEKLRYSSQPMLTMYKELQSNSSQVPIAKTGHDMLFMLHQSFLKSQSTTVVSQSRDHIDTGYCLWLQEQQKRCLVSSGVHSKLDLALHKVSTTIPLGCRMDPEQIEHLTINWRTTVWYQLEETNYAYPLWTNRLSSHFKTQCCSNIFTAEQILTLLSGQHDMECSTPHHYLRPMSTQYDSELNGALLSLAQHIKELVLQNTTVTLQTAPASAFANFTPIVDNELIRTLISQDPYLISKSAQGSIIKQLQQSTHAEMTHYPSETIRHAFAYLLQRTVIGQATICDGNSLFTASSTTVLPNQVIGFYGGPRTEKRNSYSMQVGKNYNIGHKPLDSDAWSKFGNINEYIWDRSKNNCAIGNNGLIIATKLLQPNTELFMSYGEDYDWDLVKASYHRTLLEALVTMSRVLHGPVDIPNEEEIRSTYLSNLYDVEQLGFHQLLQDFFDGTRETPSRDLMPNIHRRIPMYRQDVYEWIVMMLTCEWFYEQQCFRRHLDPLISIQSYSIIHKVKGNRSSPRLLPTQDYIKQLNMNGYSLYSWDDNALPTSSRYARVIKRCTSQSMIANELDIQTSDYAGVKLESERLLITPTIKLGVDMDINTDRDNELQQRLIQSATYNNKTLDRVKLSSEGFETTEPYDIDLDRLADHLCPPKYRHYPPPDGLTTLFFNVGTPHEEKRTDIFGEIYKKSIDIAMLLDIGVNSTNEATYLYHAKQNLNKGFLMFTFPSTTDELGKTIGGAMIVVSKRLQHLQAISLVGLGALIQLNCRFGDLQLAVFGLYNPQHNSAGNSYQTRIALHHGIQSCDVHSHIHTTLKQAILEAQLALKHVILSADFNLNITTTNSPELSYLHDELQMMHVANTTELRTPSYTMGTVGTSSYKATRIDFTLYYGAHLKPASCTCEVYPTYKNDHTPIISKFHVNGHSQHMHPHMTRPGVPRYDWSNVPERLVFEARCQSLNSYNDLSAINRLDRITKDTVDIARKLRPPKKANRGYQPNDWCPQNCALALSRKYLLCINRHVHGHKNYPKWKEGDFRLRLKKLTMQWTKDLKKLTKNVSEQQELANISSYGADFWRHMSLTEIELQLPTAIAHIHTLSNNRIKRQRREEFETFRLHREYLFQIQRIGEPIKSILRNSRQTYLMEDIILQGERITQPGKLLAALTENFKTWFTAHPSHKEDNRFLDNETLFMEMAASQHIPTHEAGILWNGISKQPHTSAKLRIFQQEVVQLPTYEEYISQVKVASIQSAGGMSGLTYGMIKSWPDHIHKSVYQALCDTWTSKEFPETWKWRWLLPIPKAPDPTISQLRPLCLLEVLRKLWSKLFVGRIANYVHQSSVLHQGQHSGRGKGTESAILEFAASLETAKEHKTEIYISSWDIRRAYDSVQRKFLLFSWTRIGVPEELALFLVSMDYDARMVVQSPLAQATFDSYGYDGLEHFGISFTPEQGTAQGGVDSSLIFAAFLDILLHSIQLTVKLNTSFYVSDIDGDIQTAEPIAYVDDLICIAGSAEGLQEIANIVSAFCVLFHLELNTDKFRAYAITWGNSTGPCMDTMCIHTKNWEEVLVKMNHDGTMVHLGVTWDMSLHNEIMLQQTTIKLKNCLQRVVNSKASTAIKISAINVSLMNSLIYETKFAPWSLKQFQSLDNLFTDAYKLISKNQSSFPTKLLHTKTDQLGLEYPQFSTQVQLAKLHMFQRSVYGTNTRRKFIMNSLTGRVIRQMGCQPARYGPFCVSLLNEDQLPREWNAVWWFSSLAKHMFQSNITLERAGLSDNDNGQQYLGLDLRQSLLHLNGITTREELYMDGDDPNNLDHLQLSEVPMAVPVTSIPLRQGQVWSRLLPLTNTWAIIEIAGFMTEVDIAYYEWTIDTISDNNEPLKVSQRGGSSVQLGAGSALRMDYTSFFAQQSLLALYYLTTLGKEQYCVGANRSRCVALRRRTPRLPVMRVMEPSNNWFTDITSELKIHTHIVPNKRTVITQIMPDPESLSIGKTTTILVKTDREGVKHALLIDHDNIYHENKMSAHVFSLHVAATLSTNSRQTFIASEGTGISLHRKALNKPVSDALCPLLVPMKATRFFPLPSLTDSQKKILDKVEKTPNQNITLSAEDSDDTILSLILMNRAVRLSSRDLLAHYPRTIVTKCSADSFVDKLRYSYNGVFCHATKPLLRSYATLNSNHVNLVYLKQRDVYRQQFLDVLGIHNDQPDYWETSSMSLANNIFKRVRNGAFRAFLTRIVYDWHLTGRNKLKRTPDDLLCGKCTLCNATTEDQVHILWGCQHPAMTATRQLHLQHIDKYIATLQSGSKMTSVIKTIHNILLNHDNWELLLGRIHKHNIVALSNLPDSSWPALCQHVKRFATMAISLYSIRQSLLNGVENFDHNRLRIQIGEHLLGIGSTDFITPAGTRITRSTNATSTDKLVSCKRTSISISSSVYLRSEDSALNFREHQIEAAHDQKLVKKIRQDDIAAWIDMYQADNRTYIMDNVQTNSSRARNSKHVQKRLVKHNISSIKKESTYIHDQHICIKCNNSYNDQHICMKCNSSSNDQHTCIQNNDNSSHQHICTTGNHSSSDQHICINKCNSSTSSNDQYIGIKCNSSSNDQHICIKCNNSSSHQHICIKCNNSYYVQNICIKCNSSSNDQHICIKNNNSSSHQHICTTGNNSSSDQHICIHKCNSSTSSNDQYIGIKCNSSSNDQCIICIKCNNSSSHQHISIKCNNSKSHDIDKNTFTSLCIASNTSSTASNLDNGHTTSNCFGSEWTSNECAINAISMSLACLFDCYSLLRQFIHEDIRPLFHSIHLHNLSRDSWAEATPKLADFVFDPNHIAPLRRLAYLTVNDVFDRMIGVEAYQFGSSISLQCTNNHQTTRDRTHTIINPFRNDARVDRETLRQSLDHNFMPESMQITRSFTCTICGEKLHHNGGRITSFPYLMVIEVNYVDQTTLPSPNRFLEETLHMDGISYSLASVIYGIPDGHFRTRHHFRRSIVDYDGMIGHGKFYTAAPVTGKNFPYLLQDYRATLCVYVRYGILNDPTSSNEVNINGMNKHQADNNVANEIYKKINTTNSNSRIKRKAHHNQRQAIAKIETSVIPSISRMNYETGTDKPPRINYDEGLFNSSTTSSRSSQNNDGDSIISNTREPSCRTETSKVKQSKRFKTRDTSLKQPDDQNIISNCTYINKEVNLNVHRLRPKSPNQWRPLRSMELESKNVSSRYCAARSGQLEPNLVVTSAVQNHGHQNPSHHQCKKQKLILQPPCMGEMIEGVAGKRERQVAEGDSEPSIQLPTVNKRRPKGGCSPGNPMGQTGQG